MVPLDMGAVSGETVVIGCVQIALKRGRMQDLKKREGTFAEMNGPQFPLPADGQQLIESQICAIRRTELLHCFQSMDQRLIGAHVTEEPHRTHGEFASSGQYKQEAIHGSDL